MSLTAITTDLLLPPASLALLALLALLFYRRRRARLLVALLLIPLVLASLPIVAMPLLAALTPPEQAPGAPPSPPPSAIVVLSADVERTGTPGLTDLGALTLERERAAAILYRRTGLPVLVTGGIVTAPPPVAILMVQSMGADFGVPVQWMEPRSLTTWENARFSAPILKEAGITRVYLVTHAWHMRRSLLAFRRAGIEAVPAPVRADPWPRYTWTELIPRTSAWSRSYQALHEWVGLLAYTWRS